MLREILDTLSQVAKENGLSQPFICGGVPRDKLLNKLSQIEDFDITTGNSDVFKLVEKFSQRYNVKPITMKDGHSQIYINNIKIDFSSNYNSPNAKLILNKMKIKPDDMMLEMYSRDFTINALLMDLELKNIYDPTQTGVNDLKSNMIRTCLPAKFTLRNDPKRIVRVIYIACKLGFTIDPEIVDWIKANKTAFSAVDIKYTSNKLQKAINYDENYAVKLIGEMELWTEVPPLPILVPYIGRGLV